MRINPRSFIRNLPHLPLGIRLHINYYFAKISGKYKKLNICVAYDSIEEGIEGIKRAGRYGVPVPVPDEIREECGVAILTDEKHLKKVLEMSRGLKLIGVFRRKDKKFSERI